MTFEDLLGVAATARVLTTDIEAYCRTTGLPVAEALNSMSLEVARRYAKGELEFGVADHLANMAFAYACTIVASLGGKLPALMEEIFLAFDSGEFYPDAVRVPTPEQRFTQPMIASILAKQAGTT